MDQIKFRCPACDARLSASVEKAGKQATCPGCRRKVFIHPQPKEQPAQARPVEQPSGEGPNEGSSAFPWLVVGVGGGAVAAMLVMLAGASQSSAPQKPSPVTQQSLSIASAASRSGGPSPSVQEQPEPAQTASSPLTRAIDSVVTIYTPDGLGSGFVVKGHSFIATNHHVVEGAQAIKAVFKDGTEVKVDGIYALAPQFDLAILHLATPSKAPPLPLELGQISPASDVWTLGSPKGLKFTITKGIVSNYLTWRELVESSVFNPGDKEMNSLWVQTDAAISPGNSGGPLITAQGRVLAVNTMQKGGAASQNLNFAIHSQHLAKILDSLPQQPIPWAQVTRTARFDLLVWDYTAEILGDLWLRAAPSMLHVKHAREALPQGSRPNWGDEQLSSEARAFVQVMAEYGEPIHRKLAEIPQEEFSSPIRIYLAAQLNKIADSKNLAARIARRSPLFFSQGEWETLTGPFVLLETEGKALRGHLENTYGLNAGPALGFHESRLGHFVRHRQDLRLHQGQENHLAEVMWASYDRARRRKEPGEDALWAIVRYLPDSDHAAKAKSFLAGSGE